MTPIKTRVPLPCVNYYSTSLPTDISVNMKKLKDYDTGASDATLIVIGGKG